MKIYRLPLIVGAIMLVCIAISSGDRGALWGGAVLVFLAISISNPK